MPSSNPNLDKSWSGESSTSPFFTVYVNNSCVVEGYIKFWVSSKIKYSI